MPFFFGNPALLSDGTNGPVAVKASGAAAARTDPALVTAASPNSVAIPGYAAYGYYGSTGYWFTTTPSAPIVDGEGALAVRGNVTSDDISLYDCFSNAIPTNLTGTCAFTNGSAVVTGTGTSFLTQLNYFSYVKVSSDSETFYARVVSIQSNTQLTLANVYGGTSGTGQTGVFSNYVTTTGSGSIAVGSSNIVLGSGTTSANVTGIFTAVDYLPIQFSFVLNNLSQRIANQNFVIGLQDTINATPSRQAVFVFNGTNNAQVIIQTSDAASVQVNSTTITLPNSLTTASKITFCILARQTGVYFYANGILVGSNLAQIPNFYVGLNAVAYWTNTGTPASNTTASIDTFLVRDFEDIQVTSILSDGVNAATIKPGGIAATSGDTAVVVAISPNNTFSIGGASTPGDGFANPTTAMLSESFGMLFNGTTWDRARGTAAAGAWVQGGGVAGSAIVGNPVRIGGSDGTNTQSLYVASTGGIRIDNWLGSAAPTVGSKTSANSVPVVIASDQAGVTVISGTAANFKAQVVGISLAMADGASNTELVVQAQGFLFGYNGTTWDRIRSAGTASDAVATVTTGTLYTEAFNMGWNGTTWDRSRTGGTAADGVATQTTGVNYSDSFLMGWNGTTWDRVHATAAAGLWVQGGGVAGSAIVGNPVRIGGSDGTNTQSLYVAATGGIRLDNWLGSTAPTVGSKTSANSLPVVIASDQATVPVTATPVADTTPATQNITAQDVASTTTVVAYGQSFITGTPTAGSAATFAVPTWESGHLLITGTWTGTLVFEASPDGGTTWVTRRLQVEGVNGMCVSTTANLAGIIGLVAITHVRVRSTAAWTGTATIRLVQSVGVSVVLNVAASQAVTAGTPTITQVASSATSVTLKAANAGRFGLTIQNDSTSTLYVAFGATASTTSYTVKMTAGQYYEVPFQYSGVISGIWSSANGYAYVTELTQ